MTREERNAYQRKRYAEDLIQSRTLAIARNKKWRSNNLDKHRSQQQTRCKNWRSAHPKIYKEKFPGYRILHKWVRRQKGNPLICFSCKSVSRRLQWANISGLYKKDIDDFVSLCPPCHYRYDQREI